MELKQWKQEVQSIANNDYLILTDLMWVALEHNYPELSPKEAVKKLQQNLQYHPSRSQPFVHTVNGV